MGTTVLYLLSITVLIVLMTLFSRVVYWFGRPTKNDYQIVNERHDQPDAKRRIIVCRVPSKQNSSEIEVGRTLSKHFDGELLFVDVVQGKNQDTMLENHKHKLEELCDEARDQDLNVGYVLATTDSIMEGLNKIAQTYHAEVVITGWDRDSAEGETEQGFLDALIDSCPARLILVERTSKLPVSKILLPVFSENLVSLLLGVCSALSQPDEAPSVNILRRSSKPGNELERGRFHHLVRSTIQGTGRIEEEWLRRDVNAEIHIIPTGSLNGEIIERSRETEVLLMDLTSVDGGTGLMYSRLIHQAQCPVILVRPSLSEMKFKLGPVFRVKQNSPNQVPENP